MKFYICGPMSGIPAFNIPVFDAAAANLRAKGFEVVSPAELDDPETRAIQLASPDGSPKDTGGYSWGDFLSRDVKLIADSIGCIVTLPGWKRSRGARLEVFVGLLCGVHFAAYDPTTGELSARSHDDIRRVLGENLPHTKVETAYPNLVGFTQAQEAELASLVVSVDPAVGDDMTVETVARKEPNGSLTVLSVTETRSIHQDMELADGHGNSVHAPDVDAANLIPDSEPGFEAVGGAEDLVGDGSGAKEPFNTL